MVEAAPNDFCRLCQEVKEAATMAMETTIRQVPLATPIHCGALVFEDMDLIDVAGPFEVLSRLPNSTIRLYSKERTTIHDMKGFAVTPDATLDDPRAIDLLIVPGGYGQQRLMDDEPTLDFLRQRSAAAGCILSVCTGALLCGAAGLLVGKRATTHWASHHLLEYFGATPIDERVVIDGKLVTAAGATSGIDGALTVAALLRGDIAAQSIQLYMEYAPFPPFRSGRPTTAPPEVVARVRECAAPITAQRLETARCVCEKLALDPPPQPSK